MRFSHRRASLFFFFLYYFFFPYIFPTVYVLCTCIGTDGRFRPRLLKKLTTWGTWHTCVCTQSEFCEKRDIYVCVCHFFRVSFLPKKKKKFIIIISKREHHCKVPGVVMGYCVKPQIMRRCGFFFFFFKRVRCTRIFRRETLALF